jgi:hypothetical protein
MRRASLFAAGACVLLAAVFSLARAREVRGVGINAAQAWEYRVIALTDVVSASRAVQQESAKTFAAFEARFNELGQDSWEYCGYFNGGAVFKRPKP